jgi:hypothetical protein
LHVRRAASALLLCNNNNINAKSTFASADATEQAGQQTMEREKNQMEQETMLQNHKMTYPPYIFPHMIKKKEDEESGPQ